MERPQSPVILLHPVAPLSQNSQCSFQQVSTSYLLYPYSFSHCWFIFSVHINSSKLVTEDQSLPLDSASSFHPDIRNVHIGVVTTGDCGMVVAFSGCERIYVQYFTDGWSFQAPHQMGFWGDCAVTPSPHLSPLLQLDVQMSNTYKQSFMLRGKDKNLKSSIHISYDWIKLDLWGNLMIYWRALSSCSSCRTGSFQGMAIVNQEKQGIKNMLNSRVSET